MLPYWIWLAQKKHINGAAALRLLERFEDPEQIFRAQPQEFALVEGLSPQGLQELMDKDLGPARKILEDCVDLGQSILTIGDEAYPARLRAIADPPVVLYYKGTLPQFDELPAIGVVGTRKASAYGLTSAKRMGWQIAQRGGLVVSGMAEGIDAMATLGALGGGNTAVAVLGSGVERVYPACNRELYRELCGRGCVLSEYPPRTPPRKWNFPRRNRIISGLSCGVLVVEAPERSGALITAREALDQGRDVFVVPGNIDTPTCVGSNALLRDGAIMVSSGAEVLEEYASRFPEVIHEPYITAQSYEKPAMLAAQEPMLPEKTAADDKKDIDKPQPPTYIDVESIADTLSDTELAVMRQVWDGERLIDNVIAQTGMPAGDVLAALTILEVKGIIKTMPGRRVEPRSK